MRYWNAYHGRNLKSQNLSVMLWTSVTTPLNLQKLTLIAIFKTNYKHTTASDADGFFEFTDLEVDTYILITKKKGYKRAKQTIRLEEGEAKEVDINLKEDKQGNHNRTLVFVIG